MNIEEIRERLIEPFPIRLHELKPGSKGQNGDYQAQIFVDVREYQNRLDELVGLGGWSVTYRPFDQFVVICQLSILGVTREDVGETEDDEAVGQNGQPQKRRGAHPVFGGVAQAFRRACAAFGLGRYLYSLGPTWAKFDGRKFTGNIDEIVAEAFARVGLLPVTRLKSAVTNATSSTELDQVGARIKRSVFAGDLSEGERQDLSRFFKARREELAKVTPPTSATSSTPRPAPSPDPMNPRATGSAMQPSDFDKLEADRDAKKEVNPPLFNVTPAEELVSAGSIYQSYCDQVDQALTSEDLAGISHRVGQDPELASSDKKKLTTYIFDARRRVTQARLEAEGRSPAVARSLAHATVVGPGGLPKPNPYSGQMSPKETKQAARMMTNPPGPVNAVDQAIIDQTLAEVNATSTRCDAILHLYNNAMTWEAFREVNEEVLRQDARQKFSPSDHIAIEKAAVERHAVLHRKFDVLNQLKGQS